MSWVKMCDVAIPSHYGVPSRALPRQMTIVEWLLWDGHGGMAAR